MHFNVGQPNTQIIQLQVSNGQLDIEKIKKIVFNCVDHSCNQMRPTAALNKMDVCLLSLKNLSRFFKTAVVLGLSQDKLSWNPKTLFKFRTTCPDILSCHLPLF